MRQSEDRRKKAAYREELKRQMREAIDNKQRSASDVIIELFVGRKVSIVVLHTASFRSKSLHLLLS